jgi:hypothetical protein
MKSHPSYAFNRSTRGREADWGKLMKRDLTAVALMSIALMLSWPASSKHVGATSPRSVTQKAFFENLKKLCGRQFEGQTEFPQSADHPLAGKRLVVALDYCGKGEIRMPFRVGEDRSRTWILTLTKKGLLFKHDHRHADGTPDKITMYGGWAAPGGTRYLQRFPADPETAKLIPEAATNVWTLQIDPKKRQLVYSLERNNEPRYKALFNLQPSSK